jgi:nitroreductase
LKRSETIASRQSIRQFTNQDVPQELLDEILETALLAPSSSNTQPYRIAVATGDVRAAISRDLTEKFQKVNALNGLPLPLKVAKGVLSGALPDGDIKPQSTYPPELHKRSVDCGRGFYETLGIERHDRDARDAQAQRNFEFFDAPVTPDFFCNPLCLPLPTKAWGHAHRVPWRCGVVRFASDSRLKKTTI